MIDNHAYEFYHLAPPRVMSVMIAVGLAEFSVQDVERVFAPIEQLAASSLSEGSTSSSSPACRYPS